MTTPGLSIPNPAPLPAAEAALLRNQLGLLTRAQAGLQETFGAGQALGPALLARAGLQVAPAGVPGQPPSLTDLYADAIRGLSGQGLTLAGAAQALQQSGLGALAGQPPTGPLGVGLGAALGNAPLAQAYQQRALAALGGQLPVDPALEQELRDRNIMFEAQQRAQWGPGYQGATPYQNAKYYQDLAAANARAAARRGDIATATQGANAALSGLYGGLGSTLGLTTGLGNLFSQGAGSLGTIGDLSRPFQTAQSLTGGPATALGNLSQLYHGPVSAEQTQQFLSYQNALNKYNADAYQRALVFSGLSNLGGRALTSPIFSGTTGRPTNLLGLGVDALRGLFRGAPTLPALGLGTAGTGGVDFSANPGGAAAGFGGGNFDLFGGGGGTNSGLGTVETPPQNFLFGVGPAETPPSDMFTVGLGLGA